MLRRDRRVPPGLRSRHVDVHGREHDANAHRPVPDLGRLTSRSSRRRRHDGDVTTKPSRRKRHDESVTTKPSRRRGNELHHAAGSSPEGTGPAVAGPAEGFGDDADPALGPCAGARTPKKRRGFRGGAARRTPSVAPKAKGGNAATRAERRSRKGRRQKRGAGGAEATPRAQTTRSRKRKPRDAESAKHDAPNTRRTRRRSTERRTARMSQPRGATSAPSR